MIGHILRTTQHCLSFRKSRIAALGLFVAIGINADIASATSPPEPDSFVAGSRYLGITPADWSNDVAILVVGADLSGFGGEDVGCVSLYVQSNGTLASTAFYQSDDDWGTVYVHGPEIIPGANYAVTVFDEVTGKNSIASALLETWAYGDADGDGDADDDDIDCAVDGFGGTFAGDCTFHGADVTGTGTGCPANGGLIQTNDILTIIDAKGGGDFDCDKPCD